MNHESDEEFVAEERERLASRPRVGDRPKTRNQDSAKQSSNSDSDSESEDQRRVVQKTHERQRQTLPLSAESPEGNSLEEIGAYTRDNNLNAQERQAVDMLHFRGGLDLTDPTVDKDQLIAQFNFNDPNSERFEIFPTQYGYGLRTKVNIRMMQEIGDYTGMEVPDDLRIDLPDRYDKVMESWRKGYSIIGDVIQRGGRLNYCAFANDPGWAGDKRQQGNVAARSSKNRQRGTGRVYFQATRDIHAGEELLFNYGPDYWQDKPEFYPNEEARQADIRASSKRK